MRQLWIKLHLPSQGLFHVFICSCCVFKVLKRIKSKMSESLGYFIHRFYSTRGSRSLPGLCSLFRMFFPFTSFPHASSPWCLYSASTQPWAWQWVCLCSLIGGGGVCGWRPFPGCLDVAEVFIFFSNLAWHLGCRLVSFAISSSEFVPPGCVSPCASY